MKRTPIVTEPKKKKVSKSEKATSSPTLKITEEDKKKFPYGTFPVKVIHKDGKDLLDKKTCYFQTEDHAKKYIDRSKLKKNQYFMFIKK